MSDAQIDPEKVIQHLAQQLGQKSAELAITATALEAARACLVELQAAVGTPAAA